MLVPKKILFTAFLFLISLQILAMEKREINENKKLVTLNVGGKLFTTYISTFMRFPNSLLAKMVTTRVEVIRDDDGHIFIDRSYKYFKIILDYLQSGYLRTNAKNHERVMVELDYYQIDPIIIVSEKKLESIIPREPDLSCRIISDLLLNGWGKYLLKGRIKTVDKSKCKYDSVIEIKHKNEVLDNISKEISELFKGESSSGDRALSLRYVTCQLENLIETNYWFDSVDNMVPVRVIKLEIDRIATVFDRNCVTRRYNANRWR